MSIINDALKKAEREKHKIVSEETKYAGLTSQTYFSKSNLAAESAPIDRKKSDDLIKLFLTILFLVVLVSSFIIIIGPSLNKKTTKLPYPVVTPPANKHIIATQLSPNYKNQTQPKIVIPANNQVQSDIKNNPPLLTLTGIVTGENEPLAIIDGEIVKKGDIISGAKIQNIYPDKVVLEYQGVEFSISAP